MASTTNKRDVESILRKHGLGGGEKTSIRQLEEQDAAAQAGAKRAAITRAYNCGPGRGGDNINNSGCYSREASRPGSRNNLRGISSTPSGADQQNNNNLNNSVDKSLEKFKSSALSSAQQGREYC